MHQPTVLSVLTAVLAALPGAEAGLYSKSSPVLQLDPRSYEKLVAKSNYTSIVEFYAPWCGHCKNLQPAFEKSATKLSGLAKVAAVDCDEESNKPLCSSMGVKGFPTLKVVRPGKKAGGKPVVEDYQGPRTANGIVEAVMAKINNHVTRVADKDLDTFLEGDKPKAVLFTEKGTTSALLRSIAIDFLDVISVGQIRNKEKAAVEKFGIDSYPTLVLIPGGGKDPIVYDGELVKKDMVEFLKQVGEPNQDPAPAKGKADKKKKASKPATETKPASEDAPEESTEEAKPESAAKTPEIIPIAIVTAQEDLAERCLQEKSTTCVLALVPDDLSEQGLRAVASLSQLNTKYIHGKRHLFPFFAVPSSIEGTPALRKALSLKSDVEVVAINARRGWWRHYSGDFGSESVESWIDAIRMGEGAKEKLPEGVVIASPEVATEEASPEATQATDPEPEIETEAPEAKEEIKHEEL